ncbi:LamG domain-containing protein [Candidatus Pacearchaeota archaeon]|nr:LamG domain-containing protein [Candidatus Pacearchaeota archaeon]
MKRGKLCFKILFLTALFLALGLLNINGISALAISAEIPSPANGVFYPQNSAFINLSSADTENNSIILDFDRSLILWMRMNNEAGENSTFIKDWSSYGNNGSCSEVSCPIFNANGKLGGAYDFDGINDVISTSLTNWYNPNNSYTFSFWYKPDEEQAKGLWRLGGFGDTTHCEHTTPAGNEMLRCMIYNGTDYTAGIIKDIVDGDTNWHHAVFRFNNTNASLYYDGELVSSVSGSNFMRATEGALNIGVWHIFNWNGSIDDFMIFKRALTEPEIVSLYANQTLKYLGVNFTNLNEGLHSYQGYSQNLLGQIVTTGPITFGIDTIAPAIYAENFSPLCAFNYSNIILNATINDTNIQNVWVQGNWEGIPINYLASCVNISSSIRNCRYIINSSFLQDGESFSWQFFANDSIGNLGMGILNAYTLTRRTILTMTPVVPDGLNSWYVTEPHFTLTNPDATNLWYRWDSSYAISYTGTFGLEKAPNNGNITAGVLELHYWGNSCPGNESDSNITVYVDLVSPFITLLSPANNSKVYNNLTPIISAVLDELYFKNSGINKSTAMLKVNGNLISPADYNVLNYGDIDALLRYNPILGLNIGINNVTINVSDNSGRNSQLSWSFEIILTNASINLSVISPVNNSYISPSGNNRIPMNITSEVVLDKLEFIDYADLFPRWTLLCGDCKSYGNTRIIRRTFSEGWHNITIRATDLYGGIQEKRFTFFVDSRAPRISSIFPRRGKIFNGSIFSLDYSEINLRDIKLNILNESSSEIVNIPCNESSELKINCNFSLNLSRYEDRYIDFFMNVSDYARSVKSKTTRIRIDTIPPVLNVISPITTDYSTRVLFNLSSSERVRIEYMDLLDVSPRWRVLCSSCVNYKSTRTFRIGNHDVVIRAIDFAGNSDEQEIAFSSS